MTKPSQGELLGSAFKESLHREEQRCARYSQLAQIISDRNIAGLFKDFAGSSSQRIKVLRDEIKNYNIKI